jgi:GAF domain-containing protein
MEELYHMIKRAIEFKNKGSKPVEGGQETSPMITIMESLVQNSNELLETFKDSFPDKITVSNDLLLQRLIEMISDVLNVQIISLLLIDPRTNNLIITAQKGLPEVAKNNPRLKVGEGISGYVAQTGQPILTDNVQSFKHLKISDYGGQYKSGSFISMPLKIGHRVVGVINVNNKKDGSNFTREDLLILELLNVQILLALRNAQLLYDQRNQIKTSRVLNEIDQIIIQEENQEQVFASLLEKCRDMVECETLMLFMLDKGSGEESLYIRSFLSLKGPMKKNVVLGKDEGIEGMVMNVRKPVLISNAENDSRISQKLREALPGTIHNIAAYPVVMFDEVVGIVEAVNKLKKPRFEREDLYLLKQITYKIFLAFMKANLAREKASLSARLQAFLNRSRT